MWAAEGQLDSVAQWQYSPPPPLLRRGATLEAVWLAEKPELSWLSTSNCRSSTQQGDKKSRSKEKASATDVKEKKGTYNFFQTSSNDLSRPCPSSTR